MGIDLLGLSVALGATSKPVQYTLLMFPNGTQLTLELLPTDQVTAANLVFNTATQSPSIQVVSSTK